MLKVKPISEAGFSGMAEEWQTCIEASDANPLFMGWPWLYSWWETWSQVLGMELVLLGVFDAQGVLVGIGPFCRRVLMTPAGVRVSRLYMLGNAWRLAPTVRTEYCDIVAVRGYEVAVRSILLSKLAKLSWDEFICTDVPSESLAQFSRFDDVTARHSIIQRTQDVGIRVNTAGSFDDWLQRLGKNTRLKAYNRRTYLQKFGRLDFLSHDAGRDGDFFDLLNGFHDRRWGKPAFDTEALRFHRSLLRRLDLCGGKPALTVIRYKGQCVSVIYDLLVGGCRFNLQAGYEETLDAKVSLGYLHLGYAIEAAFDAPEADAYDLLAGAGKKQFYKSHFQGETITFSTFQVVRSPLLKVLYKIQSASPQFMARAFSRRVGL